MYTCTVEDRLSSDLSQIIGQPREPLMKSNLNQQPISTKRGWLRNGNVPGDLSNAQPCGARTRSGGECRAPAMSNGRCRMHGGASTGPRTRDGLARSRRARWKHGFYSAEAKAERQAVRDLVKTSLDLLRRL